MSIKSWRDTIRPEQERFLEWLVDPERQGSQAAVAAEMGVSTRTLSKWKNHDPIFRRCWEERLAELNVEPDRIQAVVDAIYKEACRGDMKAAELYLKFTDRFIPKQRILTGDDDEIKDLSDEEIAERLRQQLHVLEGGKAVNG